MSNDVRIHDDRDALADDAASWILERLASAVAQGDPVHVALTGGSLAPVLLAAVLRAAPASGVDLTRVDWWWGDERFVPLDSPDRNDLVALRDFLEPLGVPDSRIHRVPGPESVPSAEEAAAAYARELDAHQVSTFEVVVLGIGPDGHVASLFPGRDELTLVEPRTTAVHDSPKPPPDRVTLTLPTLGSNRAVLFMAAGEEKAQAVTAAMAQGPVGECPARGVRGVEATGWFLDRGAAGQLG